MSSILSSLETCPPSFAIVAKCQRKISRVELRLRVELIAAVVLVLIVCAPLLSSSLFFFSFLLFSLLFFFSRGKSEKVTADFLFCFEFEIEQGKFKFEIGRREAS